MLTAGDEFGRSQQGNNNAYAQDNALTWIDWEHRDCDLEHFVAGLSAARAKGDMARFPEDGQWLALDGAAMDAARWQDPATPGVAWQAPPHTRPGFRISRTEGFRWADCPSTSSGQALRQAQGERNSKLPYRSG
jgi:glycogen operon protein